MNASETIDAAIDVQLIEESKERDREARKDVRESIGDVEAGSISLGNAPANNAPSNGS